MLDELIPKRENPWDQRNANFQEIQRFQNLIDLHSITRQWIADLKVAEDELPHRLIRVLSPAAHEAQKVFDLLTENSVPEDIDQILDESHPAELLDRLEIMVTTLQFWLLRSMQEKTPTEELTSLKVSLEQSSWKAGQKNAELRWHGSTQTSNAQLSSVFNALKGGPLSNYPASNAFILKRQLSNEIFFELTTCPHHNRHAFGHPGKLVDELCYLYGYWIKGFVYSFNPLVSVHYEPKTKQNLRCSMHLKLGLT